MAASSRPLDWSSPGWRPDEAAWPAARDKEATRAAPVVCRLGVDSLSFCPAFWIHCFVIVLRCSARTGQALQALPRSSSCPALAEPGTSQLRTPEDAHCDAGGKRWPEWH